MTRALPEPEVLDAEILEPETTLERRQGLVRTDGTTPGRPLLGAVDETVAMLEEMARIGMPGLTWDLRGPRVLERLKEARTHDLHALHLERVNQELQAALKRVEELQRQLGRMPTPKADLDDPNLIDVEAPPEKPKVKKGKRSIGVKVKALIDGKSKR